MAEYDSFHEMLPLLLETPDPEFQEYSTADLSTKVARRYEMQQAHREQLAQAGQIALGDTILMVPSFVSAKGNVNNADRQNALDVSDAIQRQLRSMQVHNPVEMLENPTLAEFIDAVNDSEYGHLIYIGHANRSVVMPVDKNATWRTFDEIDHLKKSVGILGCATLPADGVITPRFGSSFVLPEEYGGILYGVADTDINASGMYGLSNFEQLRSRMRTTDVQQPAA